MLIDVQIALGFDMEMDARVPSQQIEHVLEKADAGRDRRGAGAVEIDSNLDVGFLGFARDRALAHFALQIACPGRQLGLDCGPFIRAAGSSPMATSRICIGGGQLLNHALSKGFPVQAVEPSLALSSYVILRNGPSRAMARQHMARHDYPDSP